MKNQLNRILTTFVITGAFLLFNGCSPTTSPNIGNNKSQNVSNINGSKKEMSSKDKTLLSCSIAAIKDSLPKRLKKQRNNKDFDLSYANKTLVINGYVYGNLEILMELLETVDQFRGDDCVRAVSFEGKTTDKKFKWCANKNCETPRPDLGCIVKRHVVTSKMKEQISENMTYTYNKGNEGILRFKGFVGDSPESGQFHSLFGMLKGAVNNGCVTQVVFISGNKSVNYGGFGWELCEGDLCECEDGCEPCDCKVDQPPKE